MTGEKLTGEQLFLRYAFPCASSRLAGGKINMQHFLELKQLIEDAEQPRRGLLSFCFPNAARRLRDYAIVNGLGRWDLATVKGLWRRHHGHKDECRVLRCEVIAVGNDEVKTIALCEWEGEQFIAINLYNLPLQKGCSVYVHRRTIVEIE